MRKRSLLAPIAFLFVCLFSLASIRMAEAKSTAVGVNYAPILYYQGTASAWAGYYYPGLSGPTNISTAYHGVVYNNDTGVVIADGANVPVGTTLRFEQSLGTIAYTTTGATWDTPFGDWVPGAVFPDGPTNTYANSGFTFRSGQCNSRYYVNGGSVSSLSYGAGVESIGIYIPLSVNPPTQNISRDAASQAKLSCVGNICTVLSPGTINTNFNFSDTYGKFYYEYDNFSMFPGCHTSWNTSAMRKDVLGFVGMSSIGTEAVIPFPSQTITFNLTAVGSGNTAPTPPTITGPIVGNTSTPYAFSAQASDPDNDTLRYGIDWDMNGSVDEWAPALSYVASNTAQSANHSWLTAGPQTFQILAQDSNGASSTFTSHTITLSTVVNGLCGVANGIATSTIPTLGLCASGTNTPVTGTGPYAWTCLGSGGGIDDLACTAPYIAPPTLKICENSCNGTLDRTGQTFTVAQNTTRSLTACYNTAVACTDASGDVTASATWTDTNAPQNIISFPVKGSLQAGTPTGTMNESFNVSYLSETKNATAQVTCVPLTCMAAASVTATYCPEESQDTGVSNGCGSTLTCPGTRFCDTNYREVEP